MMKSEELFGILGDIDDNLIMRSETSVKKKKKKPFMWYGGILASAACLLLMFRMVPSIEQVGEIPTPTQSDEWGGGYGPDHPNDYVPDDPNVPEEKDPAEEQAYGMDTELGWVDFNAGPIMPLTFTDANASIRASRELIYDFSAVSKMDKGYVSVKDSYVLNNISEQEQTVTFYYPYVSDVKELAIHRPEVMINQQLVGTNIVNGAYMGTDNMGMSRLFTSNVSTDEYTYMLSQVEPLDCTLHTDLLKQKVVAYEFSDFDSGNIPGEAVTYAARFKTADMGRVYMSHMMDVFEPEEGYVTYYFMFEQAMGEGHKPAIYFLGEEPEEYEEQGYVYPELREANQSDEVTACMTRRETTMAELLESMVEEKLLTLTVSEENKTELKELFYNRAATMFCDMYRWNTDGDTTTEDDVFYANCVSDIIYTIFEEEAIYLLTDTITIPAGESVTIDLNYLKQGTHQNYEPQESFRDNYCYDNMPNLGTNVKYEKQTTSILENDNIQIESQNYGFDLEKGVNTVVLEPDAERYYMIVKILR